MVMSETGEMEGALASGAGSESLPIVTDLGAGLEAAGVDDAQFAASAEDPVSHADLFNVAQQP